MRILLIEDEKKTAAFIRKGLEEEDYVVEVARDGEAGLQLALAAQFDLFLIDVMLPKKDGWSVVEELRGKGVHTPILFLTARDSVPDRVKGLELGADDYLVKPFAFSERSNPRSSSPGCYHCCGAVPRRKKINCESKTWNWIRIGIARSGPASRSISRPRNFFFSRIWFARPAKWSLARRSKVTSGESISKPARMSSTSWCGACAQKWMILIRRS